MKLVLDTNRYTDLERHLPEVVETVVDADAIYLPFIVLAELHFGFRNGSRLRENETRLAKFIQATNATVLWPDEKTVDLFADLRLQLKKAGTPIPDHDIWIAALTLQHGLKLYARDAHFKHLPQLARV